MYFLEMIIIDYVLFLCTFQLGFCAEFNTDGALVQENFDANCKQHNPPCPPYYYSAKAYRCKLNKVKKGKYKGYITI